MNIKEEDVEGKSNNSVRALKAHLALNVREVEKSIEFYRKMMGIEPSKVRPGYAKFDVQNPPLNLTLNQNQFGERGALSHMGIQVGSTDDVLGHASEMDGRRTRDARRDADKLLLCPSGQDVDPGPGWK
jgi:catechol 2,3-dioxygenase-like lactoylglutathione lyase family enzyme